MGIFKQKETLVQNIAFMAIMAAINVVVSLVAAFSFVFSIFLIIILPLISSLTEIVCKTKYYPIYALATIGLCLVTTLWNIEGTIFYVIPSIFTGFIFGFVIKHKFDPIWSILLSSIIQASLTMATIPLIDKILDIDVINTFRVTLSLQESQTFSIIVPGAIFAISLIEMTLAAFIIFNESLKIGAEVHENEKNSLIIPVVTISSSLVIIGLYFLSLEIAYCFLFIAIFLSVYLISKIISLKAYKAFIPIGLGIIVNVLLYILIYPYMKNGSELLLLGITPLVIGVINLLLCFLKKYKVKD